MYLILTNNTKLYSSGRGLLDLPSQPALPANLLPYFVHGNFILSMLPFFMNFFLYCGV